MCYPLVQFINTASRTLVNASVCGKCDVGSETLEHEFRHESSDGAVCSVRFTFTLVEEAYKFTLLRLVLDIPLETARDEMIKIQTGVLLVLRETTVFTDEVKDIASGVLVKTIAGIVGGLSSEPVGEWVTLSLSPVEIEELDRACAPV